MHLDILTPEQTIFSGEAESVSIPGMEGYFQVLNNHAPIIAALKTGTIKVKARNQESRYQVNSGIVEVLRNKVTVLVEGVSPA